MPAQQQQLLPISIMFWVVLDLVLLLALACIAGRIQAVQRWLTTAGDRALQAGMRAEVEFYEHGLQHTAGGTGILLFVSLMERRAVVLADKSISDLLPAETWNEVIELLLSGLRKGDLAAGFVKAIERCGEILARHFPRQGSDNDELRNALVIKE
jgi:putative membrane protein